MTRPMTHPMTRPRVYTIPSGEPFALALARGVMARHGASPEALSACRILLPTRRACRIVRDAFLRLSGGAPLLLPRLQPIGDIDADEIAIQLATRATFDLPAAISPLRRQILLTRVILAQPEGLAKGPEQAAALAGALGDLMDRIQTEGLDIKDLSHLAGEDFAAHWQITLDFLTILSEHWPAVLSAEGAMDPAARREALTRAMTELWRTDPPPGPVIAAGSTGSIPATGDFLATIACLPQGCVILPGLDQEMDEASWAALDDTHPQAALKDLLTQMTLGRADVTLWGGADDPPEAMKSGNRHMAARRGLATEIMRPAATSGLWQTLAEHPARKEQLDAALRRIHRHDCDTPQEEAAVIAAIFREALDPDDPDGPGHDPQQRRTAALITPDRLLARRVAALCRRWGIEVDDSGGEPLAGSPLAIFLRLTLHAALNHLAPAPFLALLRHDLCAAGMEGSDFRHSVRTLDRLLLRGLRPPPGFSGLRARLAQRRQDQPKLCLTWDRIERLMTRLDPALDPLLTLSDGAVHPFALWIEAHLGSAESLATTEQIPGAERLWSGEAGSAAAAFLSELRESAALFPPVTGRDYSGLLDLFMRGVPVRPLWGTHPRLSILGQIEARMVQADIVVLGGLNEGVWPADPGHDPWMSRPMRTAFGLPSLERAIGLAAHDFVQGFCAPTVHLTRSVRMDGAPTVPARWLQRLDVVMQALGHDPAHIQTRRYQSAMKTLDRPDQVRPVTRPAPRPPVESRPHRISVTKIDTLLSDPYSIYAHDVLRLRPLEPLDKIPDEADRGTILHALLDGFIRAFPDALPPDALEQFMTRARAEMTRRTADPTVWSLWMRRMERVAQAFIALERTRRPQVLPLKTEARGESIFQIAGRAVTLSAIADRIDRTRDGGLILIDYKSGGTWSANKIKNGTLSQLPLEALLLHRGGFPEIFGAVEEIAYWKLTGRESEPLEITSVSEDSGVSIKALADQAAEGFEALMATFMDPATPYYSLPRLDKIPRYNDYEHLARVREWAAPGESEEAA